ncbi:MAG: P27 family phage terminase small subunit [Rhodothermales bacterium]
MSDARLTAQIEHLQDHTQQWVRDLVRSYTFEPVQLKLLILAAEAHERCSEAREQLKRDGITIKDRFDQIKRHPAVQIERDSRLSFSKLMRQLKLDLDPPEM